MSVNGIVLEVTGKFKWKNFHLQKRMNPLHGEVVTAGVMSIFYSGDLFLCNSKRIENRRF